MGENKEKFPKGIVVALDEGKYNKVIVVESISKGPIYYLMVTPFQGEIEGNAIKNLTIDYTKCYTICHNEQTGETTYNHDENITKELVEKSLNSKQNI